MKFFKCRDNRNFHLLLVGLAVIDTLLIVDLIIEVSIVGVFMQKEPKWYILVLVYKFLFIYFFYLLYILSYIFLGILSPTLTSFTQYEVSFKQLQFLWLWRLLQNVTGQYFYLSYRLIIFSLTHYFANSAKI